MFGFIKKAVKSVGKVAKGIVSNPLVKMAATGASIAFPPVGIPTMVAISTADKVLAATKSSDPKKRAAATKLVARTAVEAKKGDPNSKRGLALLLKRKRELQAGTGTPPAVAARAASTRQRFQNAYVVTPNGRIAYRGTVESV